MNEPAEEVKTSKSSQWAGEWMRDEKFWKDVAANTVAGVLLAVVIYVFGLAAGYFQRPQWPDEAITVSILWLVPAAFALIPIWLLLGVVFKMKFNFLRAIRYTAVAGFFICIISLILVLLTGN